MRTRDSFVCCLASLGLAVITSTQAAFAGRSAGLSGFAPPLTTWRACSSLGQAGPRAPWRVFAEEGGGTQTEGGKSGKKSSKRRVRKRRDTSGEQPTSSNDAPVADSGAVAEPPAPDPKVIEWQEDVIRRDVDRELVLEEFADFTAPAEPKGEGGNDSDEDRPAFKFDPNFELPIPSETVMSLSELGIGMEGAIEKDAKLPSLAELGKKAKGSILKRQAEEQEKALKELEPIEDYDLSAGILGEGRPVMGIGLPYLQSCHTVWLLVSLLCAFVDFPGFPLTNLPFEIREFLKQGLVVVYAINLVLAVLSVSAAAKRDQNIPFWVVKSFVLGSLAYNELLLIKENDARASSSV